MTGLGGDCYSCGLYCGVVHLFTQCALGFTRVKDPRQFTKLKEVQVNYNCFSTYQLQPWLLSPSFSPDLSHLPNKSSLPQSIYHICSYSTPSSHILYHLSLLYSISSNLKCSLSIPFTLGTAWSNEFVQQLVYLVKRAGVGAGVGGNANVDWSFTERVILSEHWRRGEGKIYLVVSLPWRWQKSWRKIHTYV